MKNKTNNDFGIPVGFAMALASDKTAFSAFLTLSDKDQDAIIERSRACSTQRERQLLALSLSVDKKGEKTVKIC